MNSMIGDEDIMGILNDMDGSQSVNQRNIEDLAFMPSYMEEGFEL